MPRPCPLCVASLPLPQAVRGGLVFTVFPARQLLEGQASCSSSPEPAPHPWIQENLLLAPGLGCSPAPFDQL